MWRSAKQQQAEPLLLHSPAALSAQSESAAAQQTEACRRTMAGACRLGPSTPFQPVQLPGTHSQVDEDGGGHASGAGLQSLDLRRHLQQKGTAGACALRGPCLGVGEGGGGGGGCHPPLTNSPGQSHFQPLSISLAAPTG
jgi:hypothetical protein